MADTPVKPAEKKPVKGSAKLKEVVRVHHTSGGGYTDFDNEEDALAFVNEGTTVRQKKEPDGSVTQVFSPYAHLLHGARHPDYPNVRVEKFSNVVWPDDDEDDE